MASSPEIAAALPKRLKSGRRAKPDATAAASPALHAQIDIVGPMPKCRNTRFPAALPTARNIPSMSMHAASKLTAALAIYLEFNLDPIAPMPRFYSRGRRVGKADRA